MFDRARWSQPSLFLWPCAIDPSSLLHSHSYLSSSIHSFSRVLCFNVPEEASPLTEHKPHQRRLIPPAQPWVVCAHAIDRSCRNHRPASEEEHNERRDIPVVRQVTGEVDLGGVERVGRERDARGIHCCGEGRRGRSGGRANALGSNIVKISLFQGEFEFRTVRDRRTVEGVVSDHTR